MKNDSLILISLAACFWVSIPRADAAESVGGIPDIVATTWKLSGKIKIKASGTCKILGRTVKASTPTISAPAVLDALVTFNSDKSFLFGEGGASYAGEWSQDGKKLALSFDNLGGSAFRAIESLGTQILQMGNGVFSPSDYRFDGTTTKNGNGLNIAESLKLALDGVQVGPTKCSYSWTVTRSYTGIRQ